MVKEVKPLTSVIPVAQDGQCRPPADVASPKRKGTLVLEVQDPDAVAALGEQLSLAHELMTPSVDNVSKPAARSRKTTTQPAVPKTATRKTPTKRASSKTATTTKARQKKAVEASLTVPISATTEQQMVARVQQLGVMIDSLQTRLERLHQTAGADSGVSTQCPPTRKVQSSPAPRLPDWSEPELRPHYTLQESARIYEAIEALHQHRARQTAAAVEIAEAKAIADRLRRPCDQTQTSVSTGRPRSPKQPRPRGSAPRRMTRRHSRWRWDVDQFWRNVCHLGQRLMPVPQAPGAKIVDTVAWLLATIGLRFVLNGVMQIIPAVAGPLHLLMAIPAIVAAYLAFCVDHSRADTIYRLLLVTFGLFLGGRL